MLFLAAPGELYAESFTTESQSLEDWQSLRSCQFFRNKMNNNFLILLWPRWKCFAHLKPLTLECSFVFWIPVGPAPKNFQSHLNQTLDLKSHPLPDELWDSGIVQSTNPRAWLQTPPLQLTCRVNDCHIDLFLLCYLKRERRQQWLTHWITVGIKWLALCKSLETRPGTTSALTMPVGWLPLSLLSHAWERKTKTSSRVHPEILQLVPCKRKPIPYTPEFLWCFHLDVLIPIYIWLLKEATGAAAQ